MMSSRFRFLSCLLAPFLAAAAAHGQATTNAVSAPATNAVATPAAPTPPAQVLTDAETALTKLRDLGAQPASGTVEADITEKLKPFTLETTVASNESNRVLAGNPSLDQIRTLESTWKFLSTSTATWKDALTKRATEVTTTLADLDQQKTQWQAVLKSSSAAGTPPQIAQRAQAVLTAIDTTRAAVLKRQTAVLALQDQVVKQDSQAASMLATIAQARDHAVNQLFVANAPPIWKLQQAAGSTAGTTPNNGWAVQKETLVDYAVWQSGRFFIHGAIFIALLGFFFWLRGHARKWAQSEPDDAGKRAAGIFETPVSAALLIGLVLGAQLYPLAPRLLIVLMSAFALVPAIVILWRLIAPKFFPILNALVVFFFFQEFRSVATLPPLAGRLLFMAEMAAVILFLVWLLTDRLGREGASGLRFGRSLRFAALCALAFLSVALLANALGFVLLGNLLGEAVQRSANLALILYAGLQIVHALLLIAQRLRPIEDLGMVQLHGAMLVRRADRLLTGAAGILWLLFALEMFSLRAPLFGFLGAIFTRQVNNATVLSVPGEILVAGLVIWGCFLLSGAARFVMESDVYPRLRLAHGIPYAISTMLHYAMLVIAFIAASAVLHVDMTRFTILVSAFGVGIGFGLQNIINNFVSGLILLFERPVKVGDAIQVGTSIGVVERIGIRASVLRTTSGAEMIVPNGSLISDSVTNWTLATQERIISIPFNVARGPDIGHVMDLLIKTTAANPKVLREPAPQVLVLTLGATLSFELRAWTHENEDWNTVRSDLILAINAALTQANITVA
jgi:small-conductance mechanosensitive channel